MNKHDQVVSREDLESAMTKLATLIEGLPANEQAATRMVLRALAAEVPAGEEVQGHGWFEQYFGPAWLAGQAAGAFQRLLYGSGGSSGPGSGTDPNAPPIIRDHRPIVQDHR